VAESKLGVAKAADSQGDGTTSPDPTRIAGRYLVKGVLGRGGMAVVYRAHDSARSRDVALKQLVPSREPQHHEEAVELFEREFRTLTQLSHPRVIEVYDYGIDAGNAYYTMELLDGKDLRERSPLPWREVCALLFDVCSSLALLHSRRLVHRDISPRNIRCTQDGLAKLIDFGALVPMGSGGRVVGTPPFVAPEVLHRLTVDARTDLYSLGATLYYALTGRAAYPARDFGGLLEAWRHKPRPPSHVVAEVPAALDALVMSLLSLEPALRPRTAYEVMQRLAVFAGSERSEPASVSQAYLATPIMVGRDTALSRLRVQITRAVGGEGSGVLIRGEAGVGRSRMLDPCVLEAKALGATVLRAGAGDRGAFVVAQALAEQLLEARPDEALASAWARPGVLPALFASAAPVTTSADATSGVVPVTRPLLGDLVHTSMPPGTVHTALCDWLLHFSQHHPLVIAVDDVHEIDDASAALLAALVQHAKSHRLLVALTLEGAADSGPLRDGAPPALGLLIASCAPLDLCAVSSDETQALLASVFGDVPNVGLVSARIHDVARGNPRESIDLAQHLVDKGVIVYDGGSWRLPSALSAAELPSSAEQALSERIAALPPLARWLAETQALALHETFIRHEYAVLAAGRTAQEVDAAIGALLAQQVLHGDGRIYALSHRRRMAGLVAQLDPRELSLQHQALCKLYEDREMDALPAVHHLFAAGLEERALDRLMAFRLLVAEKPNMLDELLAMRMSPQQVIAVLERGLEACRRLARSQLEINELRRWMTALSVTVGDDVYFRNAPPWLEQLERDSGLAHFRQLADASDPALRLSRAFTHALERYNATPEAERGYRPDEAIKFLVHYVVISIAVGARTLDARLLHSLPGLLEPFVALSPIVEAMWQNAIVAYEANCCARRDHARLRAADIFAGLRDTTEAELRYVDVIRHAIAYCIGSIEADLGLMSAMNWAKVLDRDALQKVNAMSIRKVVRLQRGDPEGAETYRRQAEILAAQASTRQMFTNTLTVELGAYSLANDLTGVKQIADAIEPLAERWPGWVPFRHLAAGHFERLRGNPAAALAAYERCVTCSAEDPAEPWRSIATWPRAIGSVIEVLIDLGRCEEAKARGEQALVIGRARNLGVALHDILRALALAEAKLNDYAGAAARLDDVINQQRQLGVSGLLLGSSYEARARIAIWHGDAAAVEEYGRLTAREYRHGRGSPLGAMYERLMDDARRAGVEVLPQLSEFESSMVFATGMGQRGPAAANIGQLLRGALSDEQRALRALQVLCELHEAAGGHLFLMRGHGLAHAASNDDAPAAPGLLDFVNARVTDEMNAPELETSVATGAGGPPVSSGFRSDLDGALYHPLLLACVVDGALRCAGVAALRWSRARERPSAEREMLTAIAQLLLEAGDIRATFERT
jgi:hypothetical protein